MTLTCIFHYLYRNKENFKAMSSAIHPNYIPSPEDTLFTFYSKFKFAFSTVAQTRKYNNSI